MHYTCIPAHVHPLTSFLSSLQVSMAASASQTCAMEALGH